MESIPQITMMEQKHPPGSRVLSPRLRSIGCIARPVGCRSCLPSWARGPLGSSAFGWGGLQQGSKAFVISQHSAWLNPEPSYLAVAAGQRSGAPLVDIPP